MRLRVAAVAALLGATLGAAACTTSTGAEPPRVAHPDIDLPPDSELTPGHVRPGETLGSIVNGFELEPGQVEGVLASLEGVFDARRLREGQAWRLQRTDQGTVRLFEYELDGRSVLRVVPRPGAPGDFDARVVPYDVHTTSVAVEGHIDARTPSLFEAMSAAGEQPDLTVALAHEKSSAKLPVIN